MNKNSSAYCNSKGYFVKVKQLWLFFMGQTNIQVGLLLE